MRGMLVEAAARGDAVFHGEGLAKTSGHSGGFAADQRLAGIRFFAHTLPLLRSCALCGYRWTLNSITLGNPRRIALGLFKGYRQSDRRYRCLRYLRLR